ncbi:uncharacterized protein LODBEIA_P57410 [Lodderomyces beijingensis]|uniref:Protein CSF1 n=1 Tax=Lodderomyces beijingensis TaxID=1775926 RepID=A0ABP0ZTS1_9ASCO
MAFESQFIAVTSTSTIKVSFWIYLVDWVLALILGLGFIFYFHKLLGFLFSLLFKLILWTAYKTRIRVDAMKISPLAGRIFIKNLTITTSDATISILNVTLTWRYWLFRLTKLSNYYWDTDYEVGGVTQKQNDESPSRFVMVVDGLEIFIYNRTEAFDNIVEILKTGDNSATKETEKSFASSTSTSSGESSASHRNDKEGESIEFVRKSKSRSLMLFLWVLPLEIRVKKGAIVLGNVVTPSILVASFKSARGSIDVSKAPNSLDPYRLLHDLQFLQFQIAMKTNLGYDKHRYDTHPKDKSQRSHADMKRYKVWRRFTRAMQWVRKRLDQGREASRVDLPHNQWRGLKRYVGEFQEPEVLSPMSTNQEQYAKYSLILDSTMTRFIYYYDSPGVQTGIDSGEAPESGLEIEISHGTIHYGPWADQQRAPLQDMLFPPLAKDSTPNYAGVASEGSKKREYQGFKIAVIVRDDLVVRVPTREPSKDNDYISSGVPKTGRPFGWIELKLGEGSNVGVFTSYVTDKEDKWPNRLKMVFNMPEMRTSVNHDVLFLADSHEISADIGLPLSWNGKCTWTFDQVSLNARMFLLREHLLLFSDLFADFASGEPLPYEYFRPFVYNIQWKLINYELYLNVNDNNIINHPLDFSNNKYLSFEGKQMDCTVGIPMYGSLTKKSTVSYHVSTPKFNLNLHIPPWHTVNAFMAKTILVGSSGHFEVSGAYTFYSGVEINTSNCVEMNCIGDEVCLIFYGFAIRYLFTMRENYFGDHIHFKTFEEFNNRGGSTATEEDKAPAKDESYWGMLKVENDVDVLFTFQVRNGLIILPEHLYSCRSHVGLYFDMLDVDLRFTNYYMDMQADFSPVSGTVVHDFDEKMPFVDVGEYAQSHFATRADMHVDGFSVHSHRMFGIPPTELTFWCKWDFASGEWVIDGDPGIIRALKAGISNFGSGLSDHENALGELFPPAFDAANFSFRCPRFLFKLRPDVSSLLEFQMDDLLLSYNDMSNNRYSNRLSVSIPGITAKASTTCRHGDMKLVFYLQTSLTLVNICQKKDMMGRRAIQQLHMRNSDAPFHRAPFLLSEEYRDRFYDANKGSFMTSLSLPQVAIPLTEFTADVVLESGSSSVLHSSVDDVCPIGEQTYPTVVYDSEDFTPSYVVEPDTEYDNIIVELGALKAYICPEVFSLVFALMTKVMADVSMESLMDQIEVSTIESLNAMQKLSQSVKNFRVVNHECVVHLSMDVGSDVASMQRGGAAKRLELVLSNFSAAVSQKAFLAGEDVDDAQSEELSLAVHVECVSVTSLGEEGKNSAIVAEARDLELWADVRDGSIVGSADVNYLSFEVDMAEISNQIQSCQAVLQSINPALTILDTIEKNSFLQAKLIHELTLASVEHAIDHDPDVLTRPAYILRSKKDHMRNSDGWKIVAKLRHTLRSLPSSWLHNAMENLRDKGLSLNALEEVWVYFSNWRAWESNPQQRRQMLEGIFKGAGKSTPLQVDFVTSIHRVSVHCASLEEPAYFRLRDIYCTGTSSPPQGDVKKGINAALSVGSYEGKITNTFLQSLSRLNLGDLATKSHHSNQGAKEQSHIQVTVKVDHFDQSVELLNAAGTFSVRNCLTMFHKDDSESRLQVVSNIEMLEVALHAMKEQMLTQSCYKSNVVFVKLGSSMQVNVETEGTRTSLVSRRDRIMQVLQVLMAEDVPFVKGLASKDSGSPKSSPPAKPLFLSCTAKAKEIVWKIDLLDPLHFAGALTGFAISTTMKDGRVSTRVEFQRLKSNFCIDRHSVLELHSTELVSLCGVESAEDLMLLSSELSIGYLKLRFADVTRIMRFVSFQMPKLQEKLAKLHSLLSDGKGARHENKTNHLFRLKFKGEYLELAAVFNKASLGFSVEGTSFNVCNISVVQELENLPIAKEVPAYGDVVIPASRVSLVGKNIPLALSNIIALNLAVRLFNDTDSRNTRQSLQIESEFCRVALSESIVIASIKILDDILPMLPKQAKTSPKPRQDQVRNSVEMAIYSRFSAFQFLSYNFCMGWLFNDRSKDCPGVIIGAEKFFAATEESLGKFTLMGAYISLAHGGTANDFYSTRSERTSLNRAFLPNLQMIYMIEKQDKKSKHLRLSLNGDEIDVQFVSTSIGTFVEKSASSASRIQKYMERKSWLFDDKASEPKPARPSSDFKIPFQSVEFVSTFAGSNVLISRMEDEDLGEKKSLFLHAPAIKTIFKFSECLNGKKKLSGELVTSSSENTLFPQCVPVLVDIISSIKESMHKPESGKDKESTSKASNEVSRSDGFVLDDFAFDIAIRIERQQLTLSCEPTAKVAAVVGLEGILVQIGSNDSKGKSLHFSVLMDGVAASLQHVYSRDISASLKMERILLSSVLEFGRAGGMFSTGCVTNADAYVNVKQYQDVDLFKDIWFPKHLYDHHHDDESHHPGGHAATASTSSELAQNKNIAMKFREVSTTYAFPWVVVFVTNKVNVEVDFGQALGIFRLVIGNFWAVSKKSQDWSQDLKTGINEIDLSAEGRLGGSLLVRNVNLHTAIKWNIGGAETLDVPLVLISAGIAELSLKMSFDYHVIAIAYLDGFSMDIYNKKNEIALTKDHLIFVSKFKALEIYLTSLTASNFMDIGNTISRMNQDNKSSYKEILRDSSRGKSISQRMPSRSFSKHSLLKTVKKLDTQILVSIGHLLVHVYPSSMDNTKVLVLKLDESRAKFQQNEYGYGISNDLDLKFNDLTVSLSSMPPPPETFIETCTVAEFVSFAKQAKGGTIFVFPSFKISMRTFEKGQSNVIEYLFQSSFGGTVAVRWNLGSVNFIREMYNIHSSALSTRIEYKQNIQKKFDSPVKEEPPALSTLKQQLGEGDSTKEIDNAIKETMEKVEIQSKYRYSPLAPPIIEAPQLKELGNATPPLEWFGLNRDKFPNFTHELVIVNLQRLVHEVETQYSKMLGKM